MIKTPTRQQASGGALAGGAAWKEAARRGCVVAWSEEPLDAHEVAAQTWLAERLAALKGCVFAGDYEPARSYPGNCYYVPRHTLVGQDLLERLAIRSEDDLFGGAVPEAFMATKAITHPLIGPGAAAPPGWVEVFPARLAGAVHQGFSAFSLADAREAGRRLLPQGPLRIKEVEADAGRGQHVARNARQLEEILEALDRRALEGHGIVLEENLVEAKTFSVGQVRVGAETIAYYGIQNVTQDNLGEAVYGGSSLFVVRGSLEDLARRDLPPEVALAIKQARAYDAAAQACFPGLIASRRNYDVAQGLDARGEPHSGVLEQSWRLGGASTAEVAALETFRAEPDLDRLRAASVEMYGNPPDLLPGAQVIFLGEDPRVGPLTKYTLVEACRDSE